ncbi:MAG: hypothetical protein AAF645_10435, partial [Myxococcota bacterium]
MAACALLTGCSLVRSGDDFVVGDGGPLNDAPVDMADADGGDMAMPDCTVPGDCDPFANGRADCVAGECVLGSCLGDFVDCNGDPADGCEVRLRTEAACTACDDACNEGEVCGFVDGVFSCGTGCGTQTLCTDTCADLMSDIANCGTCGTACSTPAGAASAGCTAASCDFVCNAGRDDCDDVPNDRDTDGCETDVNGDPNNCGGCGMACGDEANVASASCVSGACAVGACAPGFADCDGTFEGSGCETPTDADVNNCGGCGITCDPGAPCVDGRCVDVFVQVATAVDDVCARRASGIVECWGRNVSSSLNGRGPMPVEQPTPLRWTPPGSSEETFVRARWVAVGGDQVSGQPKTGTGTVCFISDHAGSEGQIFCAGSNDDRVAGHDVQDAEGAPIPNWPPFPIELEARVNFVSIAMRNFHACAVTDAGELYCWGAASFGQTGDVSTRLPHLVDFSEDVAKVALSITSTCALLASGEVHCMGRNGLGQLGRGTAASGPEASAAPVAGVLGEAGNLGDIVDLVGSRDEFCAIDGSGRLLCWGGNIARPISSTGAPELRPVVAGTSVAEAWMAALATCWRSTDGRGFCRGRRLEGQFGSGSVTSSAADPIAAPDLDGFERASAGEFIGCAFDGADLRCWGYATDGEVPRDSLVELPPASLVDVDGNARTDLADVDLGDYGGCARIGREAHCWGLNNFGAAGQNSQLPLSSVNASLPVIGGNYLDISMGDQFICGVGEGTPNELRCWGRAPLVGFVFPPTALAGFSDPDQVDAGTSFVCAKQAGTGAVFCAGANDAGQCGVSPAANVSASEVRDGDGALTGSTEVAAGGRFACALRDDGRVTCWGANDAGQLGRALGPGPFGSADAVTDIANATALATGDAHACAIDDGAVKCWGAGSNGQLGNGALNDVVEAVSVAVPGLTATSVASGGLSTCAAFSDSQVRCWGNNDFGQLGRAGPRSSVPVVVAGITSQRIVAGHNSHGYCA